MRPVAPRSARLASLASTRRWQGLRRAWHVLLERTRTSKANLAASTALLARITRALAHRLAVLATPGHTRRSASPPVLVVILAFTFLDL